MAEIRYAVRNGLATARAPSWLEEALPALLRASEDAQLDGTELLHFDVRSDKLCMRDGQALLFD